MSSSELLHDIAIIMTVAGIVAMLFQRLRLPVVLGYLVAGIIVGPHTTPLIGIENVDYVHTLVDLGVAFLVFTIGLEFRLYKLKEIGIKAILAGLIEVGMMFGAGIGLGLLFGWTLFASAYLGAMLVVSSTIILTKTVRELKMEGRRFARFAVSLSVMEDLAVVVLIVGLTSVAQTGSASVTDLAATGLRVTTFVATVIMLGLVIVPRTLNSLFKAHKNETLIVVIFGLCFGFALLSLKLGYSAALGAFLIGTIVAESLAREWIIQRLESMREFFTALFFVSIGILFDPTLFIQNIGIILIATTAFFLCKVFSVTLAATLTGFPWKTGFQAGLSMSVIGEFSFILAALAAGAGNAPAAVYPMMVSLCMISAALSPVVIKRVNGLSTRAESLLPRPLRSFLAVYESKVIQSGTDTAGRSRFSLLRGPLLKLTAEALLVSALVPLCDYVVEKVFQSRPLYARIFVDPDIVVLALITLLGLPLFVAMWRNIQVMALLLAELAFPDIEGKSSTTLRHTLQASLAILFSCLLLFWFGVITRPFLPNPVLLIVFGLGACVLAVWFWRKLIVLHQRLETSVQESLAQATDLSTTARSGARQILEEQYPQTASIREVVLLPDSQVIGRTLRQLRLREETGATILSLKRSGYELVNPSADTPLFPEDHVLLVGEPAHLRSASAYLRKSRDIDPLEASRVWTLRMTSASPVVGKTLRELNLPATVGVAVIGLDRRGEHKISPTPDVRLETDDRITLFGTITQLAQAGALIGGEIVEG